MVRCWAASEADQKAGAPGHRGREVERSPQRTRRSFVRCALPTLGGPFDSFADSLAQGDKPQRTKHPPIAIRPSGRRLLRACRARHCAESTTRQCGAIHTMAMPGSLGKRDEKTSSGSEGGRRRTIGGVAAFLAPHARPRRWCDAGPLGRQCVTADQKAGAEGINCGPATPHTALSGSRSNISAGLLNSSALHKAVESGSAT